MRRPLPLLLVLAALSALPAAPATRPRSPAEPEPLLYTIRVPDPALALADIEVRIPSAGRERVELLMATWSPGYYRVERYARHVLTFSAATEAGLPLPVGQPQANRWVIPTFGAPTVLFRYRLRCPGGAVTANTIQPEFAIFNGPPTFVTLVEPGPRPAEVRLELPAAWPSSATSLEPAPGGIPNRYRAPNFDVLADSPIVAGRLQVHSFDVAGTKHELVDFGAVPLSGTSGKWDGAKVVLQLQAIVEQHRRLLGTLPFRRYVFLNAFHPGRGGLEHLDSTLLTSNEDTTPNLRWLNFVSHEYFHAFNVKRLRPLELGPFDYERPPSTPSLWFSEGVTSYFAELAVARAGLATPAELLQRLSAPIRAVQSGDGRKVQTLSQASLEVWNDSTSGIGGDASRTVSYYEKGEVVGFLLDAQIRAATRGAKTFADAFRLAYRRYSGAQGFTPEELASTLSAAAGTDLRPALHRLLDTTEELDYQQALDWFGLRFADLPPSPPGAQPAAGGAVLPWSLEARPDATPEQKRHLEALLSPER